MVAFAMALALTLGAAPAKSTKTQLKIEVKPASAVVYVDGVRKGTGAKPIVLTVTPGIHNIRVVHNKDQTTEVVRIKKGETLNWGWVFEDDRPDPRAKAKAAAEEAKAAKEKGPPPDPEFIDPDMPK
jgi:PEGA domain